MSDNPYFFWVLFTDIAILALVIGYIVRDRLVRSKEEND